MLCLSSDIALTQIIGDLGHSLPIVNGHQLTQDSRAKHDIEYFLIECKFMKMMRINMRAIPLCDNIPVCQYRH
jgi:hypothetical protein